MLKLYGFPLSNYYNRVKIVLLEKGVAFEEVLAYPGKDALLAEQSPVGKIPLLDVGGQYLCESAAINEYLDVNEWQVAGIKRATASLDRGEGVPHGRVRDWVTSWGSGRERPTPKRS